jgi:hypothetical protein
MAEQQVLAVEVLALRAAHHVVLGLGRNAQRLVGLRKQHWRMLKGWNERTKMKQRSRIFFFLNEGNTEES